MLDDAQVAPQACVSSHVWAASSKHHISVRDCARNVWEEHFGVSQKSTGHRSAEALLQELKSVETPTPTGSVPLRQVQSSQRILACFHVCAGDEGSSRRVSQEKNDLIVLSLSHLSSGAAVFIPPPDGRCVEPVNGR